MQDVAAWLTYIVVVGLIAAIATRKQLRAWWIRRRIRSAPAGDHGEPPALTKRLYELDKIFAQFGANAAHPSALYAQPQFIEATSLLAAPNVPIGVVLQYVEGNSWSLASAAVAALRKRPDRREAAERVLAQCRYFYPWTMYFALQLLLDIDPRLPVGAPLAYAQDWWLDNRWMPNIFRDYLASCAARGEVATFGAALNAAGASPPETIRKFLALVTHPFAAALMEEIDNEQQVLATPAPAPTTLSSVGRYWSKYRSGDVLVEPEGWRDAIALAESALHHEPPRSLLISGEPLVGKTSFLRLLARRIEQRGWTVFEASGADLQADQIYIGQLEGRIRHVIDELTAGYRVIWYIPDIVQVAMSGRHQGQSATILDQIVPAIVSGRLVVWCEATPNGTAQLAQIKPAMRGLFETVALDSLSPTETLLLAHRVIDEMAAAGGGRFDRECAKVALDAAAQYLGSGGLPGSALLMLKLTAARAGESTDAIGPRSVLETLSQLSGLPVSILDTREQLDLKATRAFFTARVIGQDEAVDALIERVAMLKAGLNDPDKPIGVFLFAGPTGTGKTELAKAAAEFLFGTVERLIRLDMSEFQTQESIGKILGLPGSPALETDSLINRVRKQPFSVVLLDEFEKAHPRIWDLFLQAFDEGRLNDAMGRDADLRHCLFILTSNLGATAHHSLGFGFVPQADAFTKEQVTRAISQTYRPEFRNRIDKIIVFRPLTRDLMRGILKKELAALLERRGLKDRAWAIEWESSALEFLLEKGFSLEMGARPLKRAIDQYLVAPLAAIIVEKRFPEGEQFLFVRSDGHGIQAEFVDPDADVAAAGEVPIAGPIDRTLPAGAAVAAPMSNGSQTGFQALQNQCTAVANTLQSTEWNALKDELADEMSSADFWNRSDRFTTLARFALMDRVKSAAETANALRRRLERYTRSPGRHSAELSSRLALQLHLIREGIQDALENAPVEVALTAEPVLDAAGDRQATLAWCERLRSMYRGWAGRRHMNASDLPGRGKAGELPILLFSGFGAHRVLSREAGLHIFEHSEESTTRLTARVYVAPVPLGDLPAAKERTRIVSALEQSPRTNAIVRRYRQEPPLVRDAAGKWRTGRLDLVLSGEFDAFAAGER